MRALRTVPTGAGGPLILCGPMRAGMDAPDPGTAPSSGGGGPGAVSRVLGTHRRRLWKTGTLSRGRLRGQCSCPVTEMVELDSWLQQARWTGPSVGGGMSPFSNCPRE